MSSFSTSTKAVNGNAMSEDPRYKGLTNEEARIYQSFIDRHKNHISNEENAKPSLVEAKYDIFVREMIQHGDRFTAYRAAYPSVSKASARTAAARLLSKPGIARRIQEARLQQKAEARAALRMHYNGRLVDIEEKRALLAEIIRGTSVTQVDVKDDRTGAKSTVVKNSLRDRMRAMALDSQLEEEWKRIMEMPDLNPE
jgi:hypothetical protein